MTFRWTKEDTEYLINYWPHFGTEICAKDLKYSKLRVKSKVDKLKLSMLPKNERLCVLCKKNNQYIKPNVNHRTNNTCKDCELQSRRKKRYDKSRQYKEWDELFKEIARTLRYRNKTKHNSDYKITAEELQYIYDKQNGKCFYTGRVLNKPIIIDGIDDPDILSVDRLDSAGAYTPDNIVLATKTSNIAKMQMSLSEFIKLCNDVVKTHTS